MAVVWGPNGKDIFERTYARNTPEGKETWSQTVTRVVAGNLALVPAEHHQEGEAEELWELFHSMAALPAGRHLWVTGVPGRQFNRNCHRAGWGPNLHDHFTFLFSELMKGGGVGANYSSEYLNDLPPVVGEVDLDIKCRADHPDIEEFRHLVSTYPEYRPAAFTLTVEDTREGWVDAVRELIEWYTIPGFHRLIIDVSKVRRRGAPLVTFGGVASGPGPLIEALVATHRVLMTVANEDRGFYTGILSPVDAMNIDHALSACVVAGNVRRSARMSILHWRDPFIFDFISLKSDTGSHWSTNISVEVDADFFAALDAGDAHADAVFKAVVSGMLHNGEPGFYNSALASEGEEGDVRATNPCGEIALEPWESCNLGHINLAHFGRDTKGAERAFQLMSRFLIRATFAELTDSRQAEVEARNRRIGVGLFGFTEWSLSHGVRYSDAHKSRELAAKLERFRFAVNTEAAIYAVELGIPIPMKTTTVAPTGTIAKLPGVSEGIHPPYAKWFERRVRFAASDPMVAVLAADGHAVEDCIYSPDTKVVVYHVADPIVERFPEDMVESVEDISLWDLMATQAFVQEHYANNAVSFTANVPEGLNHSEVCSIIYRFLPELKGTTLMVDSSRPQSPYTRISKEAFLAATARGVGQAMEDCASGACPIR